MKLEQALELMRICAEQMNSMYGNVVFDEWVVISFADANGKMLAYDGPRKEHFKKDFHTDVQELRPRLFSHDYGVGDFEFARYGSGTKFEAFMVIGSKIYLICNNTGNSMEGICKDSRWLNAQVPFLELTEKFRKDALVV